MAVSKDSVKKKALYKPCYLCGKFINEEDIENDNFEYVKTKKNNIERFLHTTCFESERKVLFK